MPYSTNAPKYIKSNLSWRIFHQNQKYFRSWIIYLDRIEWTISRYCPFYTVTTGEKLHTTYDYHKWRDMRKRTQGNTEAQTARFTMYSEGRIQRKTWCIGPYARVDYNLTWCQLQSRLQHVYHGQPYSRVDFIPPVTDLGLGLRSTDYLLLLH